MYTSSILTSFNRLLTTTACAHLIFHYYSPDCLFMAAKLEIFTTTWTTFSCRGCSESGGMIKLIEVFLLRFLDKFQVLIVKLGYLNNQILLILERILILIQRILLLALILRSIKSFMEVRLLAWETVITRKFHLNITLDGSIVDDMFLFRSFWLEFFIFIELIHDWIFLMNWILIISILFLRENIFL